MLFATAPLLCVASFIWVACFCFRFVRRRRWRWWRWWCCAVAVGVDGPSWYGSTNPSPHPTHTPHTHTTRTRRTTTNAASPGFFLYFCVVCCGFVLWSSPFCVAISDLLFFFYFGPLSFVRRCRCLWCKSASAGRPCVRPLRSPRHWLAPLHILLLCVCLVSNFNSLERHWCYVFVY